MHQIEPATPPASFQREESGAGAAAQQTTNAWEGYPQVSLMCFCATDCGINAVSAEGAVSPVHLFIHILSVGTLVSTHNAQSHNVMPHVH